MTGWKRPWRISGQSRILNLKAAEISAHLPLLKNGERYQSSEISSFRTEMNTAGYEVSVK